MFVSLVYAATVALLSFRSFVSASPLVARAGQGVWNPPVTAPQGGDVWTVGSTQTVTWDTSEIPPSAANNTGILLLGYYDGYTQSENLDINRPLAYGFPLIDGRVQFGVPDVETRYTYVVILMGNSGNASPEFTIINPRSTSTTTHSSSSSSDKVIAQKDPDDLDPIDSDQRSPGFPTMQASPLPPTSPQPPFSDSKIDPIEAKPLFEDAPLAPALCRERHPSTHNGSTPSPQRNPTSTEGSSKPCQLA